MPSAVLPTTSHLASAVFSSSAEVKRLAAEGYFQAIAYWLNERLVPQNIYARVLEDEVPGRLKVLIEFERAPSRDRLIRFVCDRLYKLNSDAIQGVYLVARSLGAASTTWEKSVRIPTASERAERTKPVALPLPRIVHESVPARTARKVVRSQFKFFRAALVTGTAAIALVFGGLTELVVAGKLAPMASTAEAPEPAQPPWYADESGTDGFTEESLLTVGAGIDPADEDAEAMAVSFRPASRFEGRTVEAALETIAVIPHDDVAQPSDPTVTLMFGGELSLDNFVFEEASSIDRLFSDTDLYAQADVAMVGLAEPLANASTSLQEDFYHRTRPQAVQMLKVGGVDIVNLASEGTMTYGSRGLAETLKTLDRQGLYRVGAGRDEQEAHRPEILEVKGQRIAYLGYNPEALTGAGSEKAGVALASGEARQHIIEDIRAIRSQVDWVVVNYRWGDAEVESEVAAEAQTPDGETDETPAITTSEPADWQRSLAHEAVDAGADLVVGYHPKDIQGAEIYRDRAIAYSLGDFVFNQSPLANLDTAALRVSLRNQKMKVEFLPVTIRDAKLQIAAGDRGEAILQSIRDASKDFAQPMRFPAVLRARPNFKLPDSQVASPSDADYPSAPAPDSLDEPENLPSRPSSDPVMKESEALFAPDIPDIDIPDIEFDPNRLEDVDLDRWGKKRGTPEREFEPIPEGAVHRQQWDDAPDLESADLAEDSMEFEGSDLDDLRLAPPESTLPAGDRALDSAELEHPTSEYSSEGIPMDAAQESDYSIVEDDESMAPFVDPFLDPYYDDLSDDSTDDVVSEPKSIQPYAEPLVGPLTALPTGAALQPYPAATIQSEPAISPPKPRVLNH